MSDRIDDDSVDELLVVSSDENSEGNEKLHEGSGESLSSRRRIQEQPGGSGISCKRSNNSEETDEPPIKKLKNDSESGDTVAGADNSESSGHGEALNAYHADTSRTVPSMVADGALGIQSQIPLDPVEHIIAEHFVDVRVASDAVNTHVDRTILSYGDMEHNVDAQQPSTSTASSEEDSLWENEIINVGLFPVNSSICEDDSDDVRIFSSI